MFRLLLLQLVKKKWGLSSANGVGIPDDKKALFSNVGGVAVG